MNNYVYFDDTTLKDNRLSSYELETLFKILQSDSLFHEKIGSVIRIVGYNGNSEDVFDISFTIGGKNSKRLHLWQSDLQFGKTNELTTHERKELEKFGYLIQIYSKWKKS